MKNDTLVVETAVKKSGTALWFASAEKRDDLAIVLLALESHWRKLPVFRHASMRLQNNPQVRLAAGLDAGSGTAS
jgi:hypothetical protein